MFVSEFPTEDPRSESRGEGGEGLSPAWEHLTATLWGKSRDKFHIAHKRTRNVFAWVFFIKHHLWASSQWVFYCFCIFRGLKCSKSLFLIPLGKRKGAVSEAIWKLMWQVPWQSCTHLWQETWCAPEDFCSKVQIQNLQLLPHPGQVFSDQTWWDGTSKIKSTNKTINWKKPPSKYFQSCSEETMPVFCCIFTLLEMQSPVTWLCIEHAEKFLI